MITRRTFCAATAATAAATPLLAATKPHSVVRGVQLGAQSYSFRTLTLDECIKGYVATGLSECELFQGHLEPARTSRADLRKWRETVDLATFKAVRAKFDAAGVNLYAYNYSFKPDFSEAEIDRGFLMAKALGVRYITASSTVPMGEKLYPYCEKHKIVVAFHGHSNKAPGEFAAPDTFLEAMKGRSKWIKINLDIGHFFAAGFDPVEFLNQHHEDIISVHIKDRKKEQGPNMPFGQGDTPIVAVLKLMRDRKYKIPANIEYEYAGKEDPVTEVRHCVDYCKSALEA